MKQAGQVMCIMRIKRNKLKNTDQTDKAEKVWIKRFKCICEWRNVRRGLIYKIFLYS